jgi:hypothetical protein
MNHVHLGLLLTHHVHLGLLLTNDVHIGLLLTNHVHLGLLLTNHVHLGLLLANHVLHQSSNYKILKQNSNFLKRTQLLILQVVKQGYLG